MYVITFSFKSEELQEEYDTKYSYIQNELKSIGFSFVKKNTYIDQDNLNELVDVHKAMSKLSKIEWFKNSINYIYSYKVDDISQII